MTTDLATGGTLVWIGDPNSTESADAYKYCLDHAAQIAIRRDLDHFVSFPASNIDRLLVVRNDRSTASDWPRLITEQLPRVPLSMMIGSSCEGEARTGNPWPGFDHFYWHQWNQVIPDWFAHIRGVFTPKSILLTTEDVSSLEGLRDLLVDAGHTVVVQRQLEQSQSFNFDLVIIDDTIAPAASRNTWRKRLAEITASTRPTPPIQLIWLSSFPRISDWVAARDSGITTMFSKPYNPTKIAQCIQEFAGNQH